MAGVNTGRLLLGGLVAGVVVNIGEFLLNGVILADYYTALTTRLGVPAMSGGVIGIFVLCAFVTSFLGVWLYASARPRLGAGPGTALKIGTAVWFIAYVTAQLGYWSLGLSTGKMTAAVLAWGLVEFNLGILAGAWVYREAA